MKLISVVDQGGGPLIASGRRGARLLLSLVVWRHFVHCPLADRLQMPVFIRCLPVMKLVLKGRKWCVVVIVPLREGSWKVNCGEQMAFTKVN